MKNEIVKLAEMGFDEKAVRLLEFNYAAQNVVIPVKFDDSHLVVAFNVNSAITMLDDIADITGFHISPVFAEEEDIKFYLNKFFREEKIDSIVTSFLIETKNKINIEMADELLIEVSSAPSVQFIDSIIETGILNRASDIHIEPYGKTLRARYRVDGELITYSQVDISLISSVISRLKIMGGMDISEKRRPQDGRFTIETKHGKVDFRLSTLPTVNGEKIVLRLLFGQSNRLKKEELGFYEDDLNELTKLFNQPYGAIFMTGPTGSGKSTTLNSFLSELNHDNRNIISIEDPVENPILGVNHVNVERYVGLDFANTLRHILRQDPDIIMVGEIRDEETARIAMQAAITGHVVLSTLHTNDAAGVVERLLDMGIEPYFAAAALNGVISQRLVRRICRECVCKTSLTPDQARILNLPINTVVNKGLGCEFCNFTGYKSRFAVYEYIIIDEFKRRFITKEPSRFAEEERKKQGLNKSAVRALLNGHTTAAEVIKVLSRENLSQ